MLYIPLSFSLPPVECPDMFCIYWMNVFVMPFLSSAIKYPNSLFHLEKRKQGEIVNERPLKQLISYLNKTGSRKLLTIGNSLTDLR